MNWRAHTGLAIAMLAAPVSWSLMWAVGVRPLKQPQTLWWWLQMTALLPLLEEWVFRGHLQPMIKQRYFAGYRARHFLTPENMITSAIFAALHVFSHPPLWAALVFLPSLVFGWAMSRYQHLLVPVLLHGYYNAGYFFLFG